jgi:predicted ABC-type ATPase
MLRREGDCVVYESDELPLDIGWPEEIVPEDWRDQPDPDNQHLSDDELDDDEEGSAPDYVKAVLGFDPDDLWDETENVYCATGPGGRKDPTCGKGRRNLGNERVFESPVVQAIEKDYPPANSEGVDTLERYRGADGKLTSERQRLHDAVDQKLRGSVPESQTGRTYTLFGGGPASGKSSILRTGHVNIDYPAVRIDSDAIKGELPEYRELIKVRDTKASAYTHEESSHLAKRINAAAFKAGQDIVLDGTGDGSFENLRRKTEQARENGYRINAEYATCSVETAVARNKARALKTGRLPPESMLRSVHESVSSVLPRAVTAGLFDNVRLWDTEAGGEPVLVMSAKGKIVTVHHEGLWETFKAKAKVD